MKIIVITKTEKKPLFQARVFGKNPPVNVFAKTEIEALEQLVKRLNKRSPKHIQ